MCRPIRTVLPTAEVKQMLVNADGRTGPVRPVGEQHVREDLGWIPSFADWPRRIAPEPWMPKGNPLDERASPVAGNSVAAAGGILVRSRLANDQPLRIVI